MASLELKQLTKNFGPVQVLRELSLSVNDGEFLSLVGPSGCGKSTTLQLISGLDMPTSGSILIDGNDVTRKEPGHRDIAMVFQSYALYPHLTVRENLEFPLKVSGVDKATSASRVNETAERLELGPLLKRKPRELSGGQRQRVALGRALVRRPRIFLFDEPLSNLDANLRAHLRGELKKLHRELQATFIYVTHDQVEAMTLSDRIAVLKGGVLQQVAAPKEIYNRPANPFVAEFFGSPPINMLQAPNWISGATSGRVGIRPEHVTLVFQQAPKASKQGVVDLIEPMGPETWVTVLVGDERVVARVSSTVDVQLGQTVGVDLALEQAVPFE